MDKSYRRTKKFIDPEVQGALAKRLALHWVIFAVVAGLLLVGIRWLVNPAMPISDHIAHAWGSYAPVAMIMLSLTPLFVYDAVKLSNRFTGPVLRLRRGLRALASGKSVEPIQLRDGDFWHDFAQDFNSVNDRMSRE